MPSVYCENRSIGWNNTVTDDNVPERDDLWSSSGFTDSGAFMGLLRQLQSHLLCWCYILLPTTPTWDSSSRLCSSGFPTAIAAPDPSLPSFLSSSPTPSPFLPYSQANTPNFIFPPDCLASTINLLFSPQAACLGILSVSSGHLWTSLIYYPKQKWHSISTGWLG